MEHIGTENANILSPKQTMAIPIVAAGAKAALSPPFTLRELEGRPFFSVVPAKAGTST